MIDLISQLGDLEQFFVMYGPTIASVLTALGSVVVAIFKIRNAVKSNQMSNLDMITEMQELKKTMGEELSLTRRENIQLKKQNRELKTYFTRVAEPEETANVRVYKDHKN